MLKQRERPSCDVWERRHITERKTNRQKEKKLLAKSIGEGRSAVCQQVKPEARCRLLATN